MSQRRLHKTKIRFSLLPVPKQALYRHSLARWKLAHITSAQQLRQLDDVGGDAPGLVAGEQLGR